MSNKKVAIVGAGITGLSAGCYLQMNGYETEIFELHTIPGGLCTAWKRKGYTFDTCIHWLVGSNPSDPFYRLWNELIDMKHVAFVNHDVYIQVEDESGKTIRVYTDLDKLEKELLEKAPEDRKRILPFLRAARKFSKFQMPVEKAPQLMTPLDGLKMAVRTVPYALDLLKWIKISAQEFADRFENPLMKKTIGFMFLPEMATLFLVFTLSWMHKKSAGYPVGGSLPFARRIEETYLRLGGKIHYGSRIRKILTEGVLPKSKACGVLLENGRTVKADIVVSAADGHATVFDMLEGKFVNDTIRSYYDELKTFPSYIQVSLGVNRTFAGEPHALYFPVEQPIAIDEGNTSDHMGVQIYNFDPTMAPKGKTVLTVLFPTRNHAYWIDLKKNDPKKYMGEKQRIADRVVAALEKRFGGIRSNVEEIDVATPATVVRYTNNWKGSLEGWLLTSKTGLKQMKKVLPGLSNFYMAGQWVEPGGGLPSSILSARNITQIICKEDGKTFQSRPATITPN